MNGWIKLFADGTKEIGSDELVQKGLASWSKGRLVNMVGVELHHDDRIVILEGTGKFWQSDDYMARMSQNGTSDLVTRRIQKLIYDDDAWMLIDHVNQFSRYKIVNRITHGINGFISKRKILSQMGKWLTIEMDVKTGRTIFRFSDRRI